MVAQKAFLPRLIRLSHLSRQIRAAAPTLHPINHAVELKINAFIQELVKPFLKLAPAFHFAVLIYLSPLAVLRVAFADLCDDRA